MKLRESKKFHISVIFSSELIDLIITRLVQNYLLTLISLVKGN